MSRVEGAERYEFQHINNVRVKNKSEILRVFESTGGDDAEITHGKYTTRATFLRGLER